MSYPRSLLNDGEEIVVDRRPHWAVMVGPAAMIAASVVLVLVLLVIKPVLALAGLVCLAFALVGSVGKYLRWRHTDFVLTTDRLIVRSGIVAKSGLEIPLDRVTNIAYHQTISERMLGSGDLVVESAGEQGHQRFSDVSRPMQLQNLIYRQVEAVKGGTDPEGGTSKSSGTAAPRSLSVPEQIDKLDDLRQRGVISEVDFEEKKQELLDRM